ncbi:MAG: ribosome recycling factor [Candidatus Delongbacteria bacterium]|nr:ribosome recycling factor [Candidatus Delongbacteria bacterium]MCG2760028.1 ribosome recycling factor [Candidatus Delongbacteria bacterium]
MTVNETEKVKPIIDKCEEKMVKAIEHIAHEYERVKAGKANLHTLDSVKVESYGALVPLNQVANIAIPEPRMIIITPWDKSQIKNIEKGIINANLGFNPSSDGNVVRIQIPALTEETRKDLVKNVKKESENTKITIRNSRKDANSELDKLTKKGVSEDRRDVEKEHVQKITDKFIKEVDALTIAKEKEIMTI